MVTSQFGTIAQLVYADKPELNFARVVDDLHSVLVRIHGAELAPDWDYEDVAIFDLPTVRIVLGLEDKPGRGFASCLTVSVGPLPDSPSVQDSDGYEKMCSRLVERFNASFPATAILWHQTEGHLTGDLIDRLIDDLPPLMQLFPFQEPDWLTEVMSHQSPGRAVALRGAGTSGLRSTKETVPTQKDPSSPSGGVTTKHNPTGTNQVTVDLRAKLAVIWAKVIALRRATTRAAACAAESKIANDRPATASPNNDELSRVREALYLVPPSELPTPNSTRMRLAIHAMNATLVMACPPVGAAVMIYSLLKGQDLKMTARIMVLTGLFAHAAQSPVGLQLTGI